MVTEVIPAKFQPLANTPSGTDTLTAIADNPDVTLTKVAPMRHSVQGWAAVAGGISIIGTYAPAILTQIGLNINGGLADAVEAATRAIGLPAGTGSTLVVVFTLGTFVVIWVRRKWYSYTVTPEAADRAIAQGQAL